MLDDSSPGGIEFSDLAERADADSLVAAARAELPEAGLGDRVLGELSRRRRMRAPIDRDTRSSERVPLGRSAWAATGLLAIAAAAAVTFGFYGRARPVAAVASAEPAPVSTGSSNVSGGAPAHAPDPCRSRVTAAGRQPLIDDFEDGDDAVLPLEGRQGLWRWVRDTDRPGTAPALLPVPLTSSRASSKQVLHVRGARLLDWGASFEFTFQPACYDASAYRGISLRAKGPARIYLAAREVRLIPAEGGGTCQGSDCYNVHVKKFDVPAQWVTLSARWFEMQQRGYGRPALDPAQLHSIAIFVRPEDTPYDLWIDDVRFVD